MKKLIVSLAVLVSSAAMADGFKCEVLDHSLDIKVYNHANPLLGTRNAAVMVLSDRDVITEGRKTIAVLKDQKTLKTQAGMKYIGKIDLRFNNSNRKGENLLGTKLGQLKTIELDLDFNYQRPVEAGDFVEADVVATKRNGQIITAQALCERYLKN